MTFFNFVLRAVADWDTHVVAHDDNLRAGQYPEKRAFSPWAALVS